MVFAVDEMQMLTKEILSPLCIRQDRSRSISTLRGITIKARNPDRL
jgi:hypothetical protein